MKYHSIDPEVLVVLGDKTKMDNSVHPPTINYLHIDLEDWLGDDFMEIFPCYIVTEPLANELVQTSFSGFEIKTLLLSKSRYFPSNYRLLKEMPNLVWLNIVGRKDTDDFYINEDLRLLISQRVLSFLKNNFTLNYADIDSTNNYDDLFSGL